MPKFTEETSKMLKRNGANVGLAVILLVFSVYSIYIAFNLDRAIIPDEPAHFIFSKHFSTTLGIPADTSETARMGWYIGHNPFLYHWINGRVIDLVQLVYPTASDWQLLVILRLVSSAFALAAVYFCYLLSKEIIQNKWWRLLPPFLLTNTLMFVFLSGGVNYDNLAVLCSTAGLYFLMRVLTGKEFVTNSLAWMISICLGTLVKYPILPLALFMFIAWLIYTIKNRKSIFPLPKLDWKRSVLAAACLLLVAGNLSIYGYNLIVFKSILPGCNDLLAEAQCQLSPFVHRYDDLALDHKLTVRESIAMGFPNPVEYGVNSWIPNMLYRIYGILGHKIYYPVHFIFLYQLLLGWLLLLGFRYWKGLSYLLISALGMVVAYALTLFLINYDSELVYGFKQIAVQGRYFFPVIGLAYALCGYTLEQVRSKPLRVLTLFVTLALFLAGGPIKFLLYHNTVFATWFIH